MSNQITLTDNPKSLPATLGVITVGTAVSGVLLSMFSQPDHSLVDTGVSLVQYAGAHVVAASVAERAAIHVEAGRPGACEAFKQSRVGQVLGKVSSGWLAFSVMTAAVVLPGAMLSRPLIQDPTNPANWAMGMLSAAALAATIGVLNVARGNDEHITHAARRPRSGR